MPVIVVPGQTPAPSEKLLVPPVSGSLCAPGPEVRQGSMGTDVSAAQAVSSTTRMPESARVSAIAAAAACRFREWPDSSIWTGLDVI